ncbi:WXG100 family type VII secretion target [Nocardia amamiensis]|uniref:WXG100 family type VII secretion target n=1 Tax=Nocardia amamiensis TaxID=404578 RepID=UPI00083226CC|nr:WXG100 family type VII secretion target [Nocardia amamiensis]
MAIDLPHEVAFFLNLCGIPYPDINEDDVRALARHVRTFAAQVRDTHDSATGVIGDMGAVYSGESYDQLVASWARMSSTHMDRLEDACKVVEQALYAAATVITVVKVAVLAELAALAAAYLSIMVTPPLAPSAPLVAAAARRICHQMQECLIAYIAAEVIGRAIEPLEQAIDDMIKGIVYDATRHALGVPAPSNEPKPLHIEPDEVHRFAKLLDDHADDIMQHAATFADNVSTLDFTTPASFDDGDDSVAPGGISPIGPSATPDEFARQPREPFESRPSATAPAQWSSHGQPETGNAPFATRAAMDAPGTTEQPSDRSIPGGNPGARADTGDRPTPPAGGADRGESGLDPTMKPSVAGAASTPDSPAAERLSTGDPRSTGSHSEVAGGLADPVRSEFDSASARSSSVPDQALAAGHPPVLGNPAEGGPPGAASPARQAPGAAATPWGRAGHLPSTPKSPPTPARSADNRPKARTPMVTPWSKSRRTRDVPAVVSASSGTKPSLRMLRENRAEVDKADRVAAPEASSLPPRVTAPAPDRADPPAARA